MLIGELAALTGSSPRALRHYEERGLLIPFRDSNGYRKYSESDVIRVAQIKAMISAGLGTSLIQRYLDCVRPADGDTSLEMCPSLRADLDALAERLEAQQTEIRRTQRSLRKLACGA